MKIDFDTAVRRLRDSEDVAILTHANPDGDTLGAGYALFAALRQMGKRVKLLNNAPIPQKFAFLARGCENGNFEERYVISVDVADVKLLGKTLQESYGDRVDLSIDHHGTNRLFAKETYVESDSASASEIVYLLLLSLGVEITPWMADCLYTGCATDTGCFCYSNVTPRTHRAAADLMLRGADCAQINVWMFETKTMGFLRLQQNVLEGMELFFGGRVSVLTISQEMLQSTGCQEEDCDAIVALSRQIYGVQIGVTLKEKADGGYKASVRTHAGIDAAAICAQFGGGGHPRAAGCQFVCSREDAIRAILPAAEAALLPGGSA